jgi:adenylate cyclase
MGNTSFDEGELRVETATIMFADIVDSVRLVEHDELASVNRIRALLAHLTSQIVAIHDGQLLERRGDGIIVRFEYAKDAARCANDIHAWVSLSQRAMNAEQRIALRIGLHSASLLTDGTSHYGSAMNLAARLTSLCDPGETIASDAVRQVVTPDVDCDVEDLGERFLKNIDQPLRVYRIAALSGQAAFKVELPAAAMKRRALAVLAFEIHGGTALAPIDSTVELLGENMAHYLARADQMDIVSWRSSRLFSMAHMSAGEISAKLNVDWLISGSCIIVGEQLTITAELLGRTNSHVSWSLRFRTTVDDLIAAQSECMTEFVQSLSQRIAEIEAKKLTKHALPSLASHSLLTGAIGLMHRGGRENFERSKGALEYLMERHPRMHAVRPWLAQWYVLRNTRGFSDSPDADAARALDHTTRALDALPEDARALSLLGFVHFHLLRDTGTAEKYLEQAVAIDANDALANTFCAAVKATLNARDESWMMSLRALRIAPFDPLRDYMRGMAAGCALSANRLNEAIELANASVRENAAHPYAWRVLLFAHARMGDTASGRRAYQKLVALGQLLTISSYRAKSKLNEADLALAVAAMRAVGVPE